MSEVHEKALRDLAEAGGGGWIGPESRATFDALVEEGMAETDGAPDADGDVYYSVSDLGLKWLAANAKGAPVGEKPAKAAKVAESVSLAPAAPMAVSGFETDDAPWNNPYRTRVSGPSPEVEVFVKAMDFDAFPVGGSRHVSVTKDVPEPWKFYERAVYLENKRHATPAENADGTPVMQMRKGRKTGAVKPVPVLKYERRFVIYKAKEDDPHGAGARVKRVE